ncbi:MAG: SURF1 family protein [Propionibacteriales bacterium]|nr:SURF1 family protein [Propionibacteriales bacterium]
MLRFLFSRRWLGLLLVSVIVGAGCVELGLWQFHRHAEKQDSNRVTAANLEADPVPVDDVMSKERPPSADDEWRGASMTGRYDDDHQMVVSYRTRDGAPGVDVVVPLRLASGAAVLVDRGWMQTQGNGAEDPDVPPPPSGEVTVTGWVRINADGEDDEVTPQDGSVRAVSSAGIAPTLPYEVYNGFLDLREEKPASGDASASSLELAEQPDLGSGPHFFYGVQWFFFAVLAFGFWCYFAWTEYRDQTRPAPAPRRATPSGSDDWV